MTRLFIPLTALLSSVFILLIGHGLQLTVAPLYASDLGWSASLVGYTGSAYFLGFVIGCLTIPSFVARVGHIRMFGVLTSIATAALLVLSLAEIFVFWLVARFATGWAIAGVYMVIESWLNERTTVSNRGLVLSVYTVLTLISICIGQLMIGFELDHVQFVMIGAILIALGAIPVGMTRSPAPHPIPNVGFEFRKVYDASHVAVVGAFVGGLVTSGFWVLGPLVARAQGLDAQQVGLFMAVTLIGGATLQLPVGRASDYIDRRLVLAGLTVTACVVSLAAVLLAGVHPAMVFVLMFLFGGTTFPIYSLSLAHANDNTTLPLIQTGSVILLVHSTGSVIGPMVIAPLMGYFPAGLFVFSTIVLAAFSVWSLFRIRTHPVLREFFEPFPTVPRTTHEVMEFHDDTVVPPQSGQPAVKARA